MEATGAAATATVAAAAVDAPLLNNLFHCQREIMRAFITRRFSSASWASFATAYRPSRSKTSFHAVRSQSFPGCSKFAKRCCQWRRLIVSNARCVKRRRNALIHKDGYTRSDRRTACRAASTDAGDAVAADALAFLSSAASSAATAAGTNRNRTEKSSVVGLPSLSGSF